ncbi:MAG: ribulose-phosphate 3-epimerase [Candidatus Bathyarchaeota archaeon]|nr:MAG: ribulose-phosphate 3-epimerase [Candidatus Bathyarchaeota archaeon]
MATLIVPAIIAQNQIELDSMLERLKGRANRVMLDVMDGVFVPNRSLDFDFELPEVFEYEVHMMVVEPLERLPSLSGKVDTAIIHVETVSDVGTAISRVMELGLRLTLAINPETEVERVEPYLRDVDGVLVMTVNPGKYGGEFLPEALDKVRRIREIDHEISIEVDGGMNVENSRVARDAGANIIASGSFIMKSDDIERAIWALSI